MVQKRRTRDEKVSSLRQEQDAALRVAAMLDDPLVSQWIKSNQSRLTADVINCKHDELADKRAELKVFMGLKAMLLGVKMRGDYAKAQISKMKEDEKC